MARTKGALRRPGFVFTIVLLVGAALQGAACSSDGPSTKGADPPRTTPPTRVPSSGGDSRILYVERGRLQLRDVRSERVLDVGRVPSLDVVASPASPWLAYVVGSGSAGGDFIADPELHLIDPRRGRRIDLGPGFAPLWHPLHDHLAFLRPVEERRCEAEVCRGASEVVVVEVESRETEVVQGSGLWVLLAWAGDHLLVADREDPSSSLLVGPSGQVSRLEIPPGEVWDASPDGEWLLTARAGSAAFFPLRDGAVSGEEVTLDLSRGDLGEGAWAMDSSTVAAAQRAGGRSRLVTFSPGAPEPIPVPGSSKVVGEVLWSGDGGALTTTRITDSGRRLEAVFCRIRGRPGCRGLFSWVQDVVLLRMQ